MVKVKTPAAVLLTTTNSLYHKTSSSATDKKEVDSTRYKKTGRKGPVFISK